MSSLIENEKPTMRDLNRYVTRKYSPSWEDIGIELELDLDVLKVIARNYPQQSDICLRETLDKWLKLNTDNATWKTLEVALTNVNRAKLGLDPVDNVSGKDAGIAIAKCAIYTFLQFAFYQLQDW